MSGSGARRLNPESPGDCRILAAMIESFSAVRFPHHPSARFDDREWSPRELRERADQLEAEAAVRYELVRAVARAIYEADDRGKSWEELEGVEKAEWRLMANAAVDAVDAIAVIA